MYSTTCNTNTIMHLKPNCELSSWPVSRCYAYIMPPCNLTVRKGLRSFHPCVQETQGVDHLQRWCAIQTWCRPGRWLHVSCNSLHLTDGGCKASIITNSTWKDFKCFYERTVIVCVCSLLVCYEMLWWVLLRWLIKLHPDQVWWCLGLKLSDKWLIKV